VVNEVVGDFGYATKMSARGIWWLS